MHKLTDSNGTNISTLCVVSLAKVTIYMIYIEPLFLHVNFKPTLLIMTVLFNGMTRTMNGTQLADSFELFD